MSTTKTYPGIDKSKLEAVLSKLQANRYRVSGSNPYTVSARRMMMKIEIRGNWSEEAAELTLTIIKPSGFHNQIWQAIDGEMAKV